MTMYAEKLLPHNIEAEEAVLGSILIDGDCITRLAPILKGPDFYRERNALCYEAAMALVNRDQAVDQVTLAGELARMENLDSVGGMAYLSHLVAITPTSVHADDYAATVARTSTCRKIIAAASRISEIGYSDPADVDAAIRQAEDAIYNVRDTKQHGDFLSFRELMDLFLQDQADAAVPLTSGTAPIMTGFGDLDSLLGGLQRSDMVIVGARPSVGKSTLALNMALTAAKAGQTCAIFSLEMTGPQLALRALAAETRHRLAQAPAGAVQRSPGGTDLPYGRRIVRPADIRRRHPLPGHGRNSREGPASGPRAQPRPGHRSITCS